MFGISAFAQTPFASLANSSFFFTLSENVVNADTTSQTSAFVQSITENTSLLEFDGLAGTFFSFIYENFPVFKWW